MAFDDVFVIVGASLCGATAATKLREEGFGGGIVLIGAMLIAGSADSTLEQALAFVAVVFGTVNVVGGFLVTDRMLEMFKRKPSERE